MAGPRNATTTGRGRTYKWRDETFDSVTTIIGGGVPKGALPNWAAKSVAEYVCANLPTIQAIVDKGDKAAAIDLMKGSPWRARDEAAANGSDVHAWAEAHVLGHDLPIRDGLDGFAEEFKKFLLEYQPVFEMSEATVYNREHGYAGTLDAIAVIGGRRMLIDYKTGNGVYGEVAMQLAAYRFAEFVGMPDGSEVPMPEVDGCAVLHLRPRSHTLIPVRAEALELRYFLYAREIRQYVNVISREVLGAPLGPEDLAAVLEASIAQVAS